MLILAVNGQYRSDLDTNRSRMPQILCPTFLSIDPHILHLCTMRRLRKGPNVRIFTKNGS